MENKKKMPEGLFYENGNIYYNGVLQEEGIPENKVYRDDNGKIVNWASRSWYGYSEDYKPLYPDHDFSAYGIASGWTDDWNEKEAYYDTCPVEFLIEECNRAIWEDDITPMLRSLYKRQPERAIELAKAIIELKKGDEFSQEGKSFLQEEAKDFLEERGVNV
jgi:hypothetical protein